MSNRQHLLRGKRKDTGEWVYGDLRQDRDLELRYIGGYNYYSGGLEGLQREPFEYEVIPETIGEWTGLCYKNGVKIFEDDIVKVPSFKPEVMHIGFIEGAFCLTNLNGKYAADMNYIHPVGVNESEVIGNIHDNPELLEV